MATTSTREPLTIYHGRAADIPALRPLLEEAHRRMHAPHTAAYIIDLLELVCDLPTVALFIVKRADRYVGYCWCEVLTTGELFIHQCYQRPGIPPDPLAEWIHATARAHGCRTIIGITHRKGGARLFGKYGARPVGVLLAKELT